jgi:hypothetical protein
VEFKIGITSNNMRRFIGDESVVKNTKESEKENKK